MWALTRFKAKLFPNGPGAPGKPVLALRGEGNWLGMLSEWCFLCPVHSAVFSILTCLNRQSNLTSWSRTQMSSKDQLFVTPAFPVSRAQT